ncbi:ankyrin repeat domain-containing protein [bacterium]|nr:MAG: ankyrin repeat domain-containing protein [bacterium]
MKKTIVSVVLLLFVCQLSQIKAQSTDTSASNTEQTTKKTKKQGFFARLFNWGGSSKKKSVEKEVPQVVQLDYGKMDLEELNYRFIQAAIVGETDDMIKMLRYGANINTTNSQGRTALIEVARLGTYETARWLIDRGASVNYKDMYDGNALIYATQAGKREIVNLLIQNGARKELEF